MKVGLLKEMKMELVDSRGVHGLFKPFYPTQTGPIFGRIKSKILNRSL